MCAFTYMAAFASVDKGTRGFLRGKTTPGCVILIGGRQPACLVCLASRRLSSAKNSEGLAGAAGALPARQRTQACRRKPRTITPQAAFQPRPQACVPLSTDASLHAYRSGGNKACQKCEAGACRSPADNTINSGLTVHSLLLFSPFYNINYRNTSNSTEFCRLEGL